MFPSIKSTVLFLTLLVLVESTRLCRDCIKGEVTYNITDSQHGNFFSKITGDCVVVHHVAAKDGAKFDDLGSGQFNFTSSDKWIAHCNLTPHAIGCCEYS
jgi:hypothetical protein